MSEGVTPSRLCVANTATLAGADPADKAKVYAEMGIDITFQQDGRVRRGIRARRS